MSRPIAQIVITKDDEFKVITFTQDSVDDVSFHCDESAALAKVKSLITKLREPKLKRLRCPK